jgi:3-phenylpropionate/trans-cinnamate dioxygenase ferredoxin reductase subunit
VSAAASYVEAGGPGPVLLVSADGDPHYQRPPLSKGVLAGEDPAEREPILDDEEALGKVEVVLDTRVERLDTARRRLLGEGLDVGYQRLVVATGSDPVPFPDMADGADVHYLRSLADGRRLAAAADTATTAVVVGSGFIGCEAAASLAGRGIRTTLVTPEATPLQARLGTWAGERIADWLRTAGVDLHTEVEVARIEAPHTLQMADGSELSADLLLVSVGVTQERPFLADLEAQHGRLVVDRRLRTSDPAIWAAGDVALAEHAVAGRHLAVEHWGDALAMGELAGANAAAKAPGGEPKAWEDAPGFWSTIGEHTLKYSAWGDGYDEERIVDGEDGVFTIWYADEQGELVGVLTHEHDDDYERGGDLLARRATLEEALTGG